MKRKSVLRSVRLDDDVWEAVKDLDVSLNQYLRARLIAKAPKNQTSKEAEKSKAHNLAIEIDKKLRPSLYPPSKPPLLKPKDRK